MFSRQADEVALLIKNVYHEPRSEIANNECSHISNRHGKR